jgi:hypothetical protein
MVALEALAGLPTPARAGEMRPAEQMRASTREKRSVGRHLYSQFANIEWPFVATRARSRAGIGISEFELSGLDPDRELSFEGSFVEISQLFELNLALLDWLGLEVEARAAGITGTDSVGALFVGANGVAGLRLSGVAQLMKTDVVLLSARLDVTGLGAVGLAPARVATALTRDDATPASRIDPGFEGDIGGIGAALTGAVTATHWLGFMGSVFAEGRRVEINDVEDDEGTLSGALGASLHFGELGLPLQILVGSRVRWNFEDDVSDVSLAVVEGVADVQFQPELALYYTDPSRPNLELGVTTTFTVTDASERGHLGISLAYWW